MSVTLNAYNKLLIKISNDIYCIDVYTCDKCAKYFKFNYDILTRVLNSIDQKVQTPEVFILHGYHCDNLLN